MKFSLFFEIQIADPTAATEAQAFHDCVAQAVLADELGYHSVWAVEHHGLYEYSHCSAPETLLAFIAAKTKRIRIGHGVTLLPNRYNHPIRVAERIATLDILSGGRVSCGTGKSSSAVEQGAFGCDPSLLHDEWAEAIEMIPRMWSADVFSHAGRFYEVPPTQILPKPVQRPHPPMYMACSRLESLALAGKMGLGALNFAGGTDAQLGEKVRTYRAAIAAGSPATRAVTNQFVCTPSTLVLPDDREACRWGFRGAQFFLESMMQYYVSRERPVGRLALSRDFLEDDELERAIADRNAPGSVLANIVGDPISARESVQRCVSAGVDELILVMQLGTVPQDLVMRSIRTFAEQVMPHFGRGE